MPAKPREQQIALLTEGVELPLPPIQSRPLRVILETLEHAWATLGEIPDARLPNQSEPDITTMMCHRLNQLLDQDPLWEMLVQGVTRGRESLNFDGSRLELRPDLSIQLTGRNPNFPLVVECKLIDRVSRKSIDLYCEKGLSRFVVGDYAWYAREAIMLAYVRDGSTIKAILTPHLQSTYDRADDPWATAKLPVYDEIAPWDLARSHHRRKFRYLKRTTDDDPGPIDIWHLWLQE